MFGIVIDVSATFVDTTINQVPSLTGLNTNYCFSGGNIENSGRTLIFPLISLSSLAFILKISFLPVRKTRIPPSGN